MNQELRLRSRVPNRVLEIDETLKKLVAECSSVRLADYWPGWYSDLLKLREQSERFEDVVISLLGGMRTGKSTLINALVGVNILPTGGEQAVTSTVTEVGYAEGTGYEARIEFMSKEEWQRVVAPLLAELRGEVGEGRDSSLPGSHITAEARAILTVVYDAKLPEEPSEVANLLPASITEALTKGSTTVRSDDILLFRDQIAPYIDSTTSTSQPTYWPIVRKVSINGPFETLAGGIRLIDLPGINDPNPAREAVTRNHLRNCRYIWFVFNMRGILDKGLSEVITSDQFVQMVLDGRVSAMTFIGTRSDEFHLVEARKRFQRPAGTKAELARVRNINIREVVQGQLLELFQRTCSGVSPSLQTRQQALKSAFIESPIFTVSAWDYLASKYPEMDPEETRKLEEADTEIPALLEYMQERCREFGIQAQERQLHNRIDSHLLELKQEISAQRISLEQQPRTDHQQEILKKAINDVCNDLQTSLEDLTSAYGRDLEKSRSVLYEQLKEGIDKAEEELEAILIKWNGYTANQLQAVVRAATEGEVFYSRTLKTSLDFAKDLSTPILKAVAFAWDEFFGSQLTPSLDRRGKELLDIAEKHGRKLVTAVQTIVTTDDLLQSDLNTLIETTHTLLVDHFTEAKAQMKREISSRRKTLYLELPSRISKEMEPGFTSAARQPIGDGVKRRMLDILDQHARQVSTDMHSHVERTIMEGIKKLCCWLLEQFKGMAKMVSGRMEKVASGLRPVSTMAPAADILSQRSCLQQIEALVAQLLDQFKAKLGNQQRLAPAADSVGVTATGPTFPHLDGHSQPTPSAAHPPSSPAAFPRVGTPEWGRMNRRRAELIRKEIAGTLTPDERPEYERLQRESLAALDKAFPRPEPATSNDTAEAPGA